MKIAERTATWRRERRVGAAPGVAGGVLREEKWVKLTDADRRGLSPLFWSHANLYGTIEIDMDTHLDLGLAA